MWRENERSRAYLVQNTERLVSSIVIDFCKINL